MGATPSARQAALIVSFLFLIGASIFSYLQFQTEAFVGIDGYYHSKISELLFYSWGLPLRFISLPFTVLSETRYVDHHYLFHVLLSPFAAFDLRLGSKWGAVFFASLAYGGFLRALPRSSWLVLVSCGALYFAISPAFLYRMSMIRAQSLSLCVLLFLCMAMLQRKPKLVAALCFIYVWTYNAFPLVFIAGLCFAGAEWFSRKKVTLSLIAAIVVGTTAGVLINPYFPENVFFLFHHLVDKFQPKGYAVAVGNEWYAYPPHQFLQNATAPLLLLALTSVMSLPRSRVDIRVVFYLFMSICFLILFLKSRRFVELFPPFALLAFAWSAQQKWQEVYSRDSGETWAGGRLLASACIAVFLAVVSIQTIRAAALDIRKSEPYTHLSAAISWLRLNAKPGSLVINSDWSSFPRLYHFANELSYFAGLDPYFSYAQNPSLFKEWISFTQGNYRGKTQEFLDKLGAEYIFVEGKHRALKTHLNKSDLVKRVFSSKEANIYYVLTPPTSSEK